MAGLIEVVVYVRIGLVASEGRPAGLLWRCCSGSLSHVSVGLAYLPTRDAQSDSGRMGGALSTPLGLTVVVIQHRHVGLAVVAAGLRAVADECEG